MKIVTTIDEVRKTINTWKSQGLSVGFVPTKGYLHEGHQSLIKSALENDRVVVSIFVNPVQFSLDKDLINYPCDLERDCTICEGTGANLVFAPDVKEMYDDNFHTYVDMSVLTEELCSLNCPDHFRDICTVITKLFNIVLPDKAYFGQKDAQQLVVIKQMVKDLNMDIEIVGCPIIRGEDGLAKSSRNAYLSADERKAALILSKTIRLAQGLVQSGEKDANAIINAMKDNIETELLATIDYIKIVDAKTMKQVKILDNPVLVAIAVYIGNVRLIDNFST